MFWESVASVNHMSEDTSIEEVLDDDYIVQHVMARSSEVIDYLSNEDRISRLIEMVIDQSNITFDTIRFKRPSVAAEILSSGVPSLVDVLLSTNSRLKAGDVVSDSGSIPPVRMPFVDSLLSFLYTTQPLNPLSASFFVKIMTNLFYSRAAELIPYLLVRWPDFLSNLLRHIECPAICELLIEMTHQDNDQQHVVAQWFLDCSIPSKLLDILSLGVTRESQESAASCLVELVGIYRNHVAYNSPDERENKFKRKVSACCSVDESATEPEAQLLARSLAVLDIFESENFITRLLDMVAEKSSPNAAIDVFLACVDKTKSRTGIPLSAGDEYYDIPSDNMANAQMPNFMNPLISKANCSLLKMRTSRVEALASTLVIPRLPKLYSLLQPNSCIANSQRYPVMRTTVGVLNPPLGKERLAIVNFISILPQLCRSQNNASSDCQDGNELTKALCRERFLPCLMHLFETYAFNSLLHKAVLALFENLLSPPRKTSADAKTSNSDTDANNSCEEVASNGENETRVKLPDYLVRHLLDDCRIIEWILRIACLPTDKPSVKEHTLRPQSKPGYSGHLWRIANLVNSRFPTDESLLGLPSTVLAEWQTFVQRDLTATNEAQAITKVNKTCAKPNPISLGSLYISGPDNPMAQLFKIPHCNSNFVFNSLHVDSAKTVSCDADPCPDPNEEAFDSDEDNNGKEAEAIFAVGDEREGCHEDAESSSDEAEGNSESIDSSDEEDLQSPLTIRQHRTNQTPVIPDPANGNWPLDSLSNTTMQSPWSRESATTASSSVLGDVANVVTVVSREGDKDDDNDKAEDWADFESASFGEQGNQ